MKKIEKLNLNQLSKAELKDRQMNSLKGGGGCACVWCLCAGGLDAADNTDDGGTYIASVVASWC